MCTGTPSYNIFHLEGPNNGNLPDLKLVVSEYNDHAGVFNEPFAMISCPPIDRTFHNEYYTGVEYVNAILSGVGNNNAMIPYEV